VDGISFVISRFAEHLGGFAVMLGLIALLGVFERIVPAQAGQSIRGRVRNVGFVAIYQLAGGIVVSALFYLALPLLVLPSDTPPRRSPLEQAAVVVLYIFLTDMVFYWYHRAQHSLPLLWPVHELHHSDDQLNATSSLRTYLLDRPLQFIVISLPIAAIAAAVPALGAIRLSPEVARLMYLVSVTWLFFSHANIRLQLGRCSWVATGPQLHRLHHSIESRHQGRNFAQFFPVLDVVFGTYQAPQPNEFPCTGTPDMPSDTRLTDALRRPFQQWFRAFLSQIPGRRHSQ